MPKGVKIRQQGGTDQRFRDLWDLLENYKEHLVHPYSQPLPEECWFQVMLVCVCVCVYVYVLCVVCVRVHVFIFAF